MAEAERATKRVERIVYDEVPDGVTLHLTESEASAVFTLVGRCIAGTYPTVGIFNALYDAGVQSDGFYVKDGPIQLERDANG